MGRNCSLALAVTQEDLGFKRREEADCMLRRTRFKLPVIGPEISKQLSVIVFAYTRVILDYQMSTWL
ncbi:hypothetical protein QE152_g13926 [Popillia japonica]|uniref:Uncharacterized protein n=1 Tax=Popillia japonica TaxID=7064 RepID=A0AAW1LBQ4_POPJA